MWSLVIDFLLGLIGLSRKTAAERAGEAEERAKTQATVIQEVKAAHDEDIINARLSDDAIRLQTAKFQRHD